MSSEILAKMHIERMKIVPWNAKSMYDLVADIQSYPLFIPWCKKAEIINRAKNADGSEKIIAILTAGITIYQESFTSHVMLYPDRYHIAASNLDGPFSHMDTKWIFTPLPNQSVKIDFCCDYAFKNKVLYCVFASVFDHSMNKIMEACLKRAEILYGKPVLV